MSSQLLFCTQAARLLSLVVGFWSDVTRTFRGAWFRLSQRHKPLNVRYVGHLRGATSRRERLADRGIVPCEEMRFMQAIDPMHFRRDTVPGSALLRPEWIVAVADVP